MARLATARQIMRASDLDHGGVDATPEALAGLLATYGRIALVSPEGDVFDQMAGRYNQAVGPNLGVYLKGQAGDLLRIDRRGRPRIRGAGRGRWSTSVAPGRQEADQGQGHPCDQVGEGHARGGGGPEQAGDGAGGQVAEALHRRQQPKGGPAQLDRRQVDDGGVLGRLSH
jgi:hypothetical protein